MGDGYSNVMYCYYHNGVWTYGNIKSAYSPEELVQIRKDLLAKNRELERQINQLMADGCGGKRLD